MANNCRCGILISSGLILDQPSIHKVNKPRKFDQASLLYLFDTSLDSVPLPEIGTMGLDCNSRYLILSVDPDVVLPGTGVQTVVLHWYQSNLTFSCNGEGDFILKPSDDVDSNTAPYVAPQPPAGSHHRYVFLLFNQSQSYEFPDCFQHIPPQTVDARGGFDIREFMTATELDPPVAINYFYGRRKPSHDKHPLPSSSATQTSFKSLDCQTTPTSL
jgi:hypothetical protein